MKFWQTLYAVDRRVLYAILIVLVAWQVLMPITVPNVVLPMSQSMFDKVDSMKEGSLVLVESDWTTSTGGESRGQFKGLVRHLIRKRVRFILTAIDPLAPGIARIAVGEVLKEEPTDAARYVEGTDWAVAGYFPNAENHVLSMVTNVRKTLGTKGITDMPIMRGIKDLSDFEAVILVTASSSINVWYERIRGKAPIGLMCTAVMAGENIPYYASGQLFGMIIGAKGAFDYEDLLNTAYSDKKFVNYQSGRRYMSPLFFALVLLIVSVIVGNVAMVVLRKRGVQQ
ncbi:MAG: hypothetical protein H0W86_09460 [Armatimonadetes bacterium]|nr:hypothetical protein [Armatimonadota bacterium]